MKRLIPALLLSCSIMIGCSEQNHNFFKPEIPDVTYAVPGDPTADDSRILPENVKAILDTNIRCYGPMPCIDMDGTFEGWGFVDDGAYYAAPSIQSLNR